ncbi:peptide deformylase [Alkalicoccus urumqiensis]|uniref:Peptide deformylase n=1 Tax=Alkalicoccus urumqiensis TaxID=1548213 RepID=A0A2P6MER6_ALKUR|nr:peptide deformylase [Alkalicoccus urumqiensis]PRO64776.1 peptide deformylase [Alkalicoccus urumqiensis]
MITMNDIIREGHPGLRTPAETVPVPLTESHKELAEKMIEFLRNGQDPEAAEKYDLRPGVGLAAPQLNEALKIIAVRTMDDNGEPEEHILINPEIVSHSRNTAYLESGEGCLSVDRPVEGIVPRYSRIKVDAYDLNGEKKRLRFRGYEAIVVQHEIDHLHGIMFYDRIEEFNDKLKQPLPPHAVIARSDAETVI